MDIGSLTPEEQRFAENVEYSRLVMKLRVERFAQKRRSEVREIVDERLLEIQGACACQCRHRVSSLRQNQLFQLLPWALATLRRSIGLAPDQQEKKPRETALNSRLPNSSLSDGVPNSPPSDAKAGGASSSTREGGDL